MDELLSSIAQTSNEQELHDLMSLYKDRSLSIRFMVRLLSREPDWQGSLALFDWINEEALYPPSVSAYNVVLRNVLCAKHSQLAYGLFDEMRQRAPSPGDLLLCGNLIGLSRKLRDYSKTIFSRLKRSGTTSDIVAYNSTINVFGKAKLFSEARLLIKEMRSVGAVPDTVSYSTLLNTYVENHKFVEAMSVFSEMNEVKCPLDLTTCNIVIDVYGQLDMAKEADRLFWSIRKMGIEQNVSYNTPLKVYGEAELFGEATHLFRLM